MFIKATLSIWNRNHEDGSYEAEHEGWKLLVTYTPEPPLPKKAPCGFSWVATSPEGKEQKSSELIEEPEMAMMQAEQAAGLRDAHGEPVKAALPHRMISKVRPAAVPAPPGGSSPVSNACTRSA